MRKIAIVHYGEIAIKGENRIFFEKQLVKNIKRALLDIDFERIQRLRGRIIIRLPDSFDEKSLCNRLSNVFGIAYFSIAVVVERNIDMICDAAWYLLADADFQSFAVSTRRSQKQFRLNSMQINQKVGAFVQARCDKRVDLREPDITVHIEITEAGALLFTQKIPGLRGLPVGVSERAVSLLSSGIDSPVASYLMLKRGVDLVYTHFHSQPYTNPASQENSARLVELLTRLQLRARVYFIPFMDIQKEIMAKAPADLRVLLYRRYMIRLSGRVAVQEKCRALVTGENVAQVASQTLSNIGAVSAVSSLPILRPLAGFDKDEIVKLAHKIGSFEISTAPYEDCCTLFVPQKPATKARAGRLLAVERHLEMETLMDNALHSAEIRDFSFDPAKIQTSVFAPH